MATANLISVVRMVASLLNAAKWRNYLQGSISGTTLTAADGQFVAGDLGKAIAVDGAGSGGTILETTIAAFTNATTVELATPGSTAVQGATVSYGGQLDDDRRNLFELREAAFEADEDHYLAIAETVGHWARPDIMELSGPIAHSAEIPEHIGELGQVFVATTALSAYEPGKPAEYEEIRRMRLNTGVAPFNTYGALAHNAAGSQIGGYYRISEDGNYAALTGDSMKAYIVPPYSRGSNLKSPIVFTGSLVSRAVARLLAKEGARTPDQLRVHAEYSNAVIQGIRSKMKALPTLESFEERAQQRGS